MDDDTGERQPDTDEWRELELLESAYLKDSQNQLAKHWDDCTKCQFLGFAYRGIVIHGGREHTFKLSLAAESTPLRTKIERLIKIYLSAYGKATTFTNLILETLWPSLQDISAAGLSLHLGTSASAFMKEGNHVSVSLSSALLKELGSGESVWQDTAHLAEQGGNDERLLAECRTLLRSIRTRVGIAASYALSKEGNFAWDLVASITPSDVPASHAATILETWLSAFQGLLLLEPIVGEHWVTVPLRPGFGLELPAHTRLPLSALTVAARSSPAPIEHVLSMARALEAHPSSENHAAAIKRRQSDDDQRFFRELKAAFPRAKECGIEWRHMRVLPELLRLSKKLVGKRHEGTPLSFTILCAPDSHLLKLHRGSHDWTLSEIHAFPLTWSSLPTVDGVAREMESNAFVLQDPGRALFFRPHSLWPSAVVQFRPFDIQQRSEYLRAFTMPPDKIDPPALAFQTSPDAALLFAAGKQVAACRRNEWTPVHTDLQAPEGHHQLLTAIQSLKWWSALDVSDQGKYAARLETVARAVVEASRKGYGALFFVTQEWRPADKLPRVTTMAPVWAKRRVIEHDDPGFIAAFAGLDGETHIELGSGFYITRQFALVPTNGGFLETFTAEGEQTTDFKDYLEKYDEFLRKEELTASARQEWCEEVAQFGTRHMKALRITRSYPESTIAVTVSSNGPVRVWHDGFPKNL